MTNEIKNIPQLRFPNFDGDWEECKLEEISDKVTEKNKNNQFSETLTNSAEYGVISQRDFFDKDISNEKNLNGYYIVQEDDFVYNPRISNFAPVGPIKRNKLGRTGVMSPLYYVFRTRNIDVVFLDYYFETTGWHKFMKLNGDSGARADRFAIKDLIFKTMPIPYPIIEEQEKIGNFFSKLDRQIELEEQKLEKLEEQKKGYMQKIFSQKLRFKDENGDEYPEWKSKKLKDIANVYQPQNLSQNNFQKKGYPVYGANGVIGYYKDFNHSNMEIAVACRGNTCGRVNLTEPKSWITSNAMVVNIIDKMEIEFYFLYQYLRIINYSNVISGSGQPQITRKNMNSVELLVPNYIEQQKIGNLFRRFDDFIEKQSQKIDLLKECKKGFLQKMFV